MFPAFEWSDFGSPTVIVYNSDSFFNQKLCHCLIWKLSSHVIPIFRRNSTSQLLQCKSGGALWTFCQCMSSSPLVANALPHSEQGLGSIRPPDPSSIKSEKLNVWFWVIVVVLVVSASCVSLILDLGRDWNRMLEWKDTRRINTGDNNVTPGGMPLLRWLNPWWRLPWCRVFHR